MIQKRLFSLPLLAVLVLAPASYLHAQWLQVTQWQQTAPLEHFGVSSFAVVGTNLFAATGGIYGTGSNGVFLSTDNGVSWTSASDGLTNDTVNALFLSGANLFAGTNSGVFISANGGRWTHTSSGLEGNGVTALAVSGPNLIAGTNGGGVFLSADHGMSWTVANTTLSGPSFVLALEVSGTNLVAGTLNEGIFYSSDNGANWKAANPGIAIGDRTPTFASIGTQLLAGILGIDDSVGIYISTNNGESWAPESNTLLNSGVFSLSVVGANVFAGTHGIRVCVSTDNGVSWNSADSGLRNIKFLDIAALTVDGSDLFAGSQEGEVYRRPLSEMITPSVVLPAISSTNSDIESYPNPFSQSTQISFTSESAGYADISVVNLLGEQVARIFSGELDAGPHNFTFSSTAALPDGTYECRIRMNGRVETLPMMKLSEP